MNRHATIKGDNWKRDSVVDAARARVRFAVFIGLVIALVALFASSSLGSMLHPLIAAVGSIPH
jgi:hypothetical protein